MLKKIAVAFFILSLNAYAGNFGNLQSYFANESKTQTFLLFSGYAHLNFIGGFADGNYKLVSYSIKPYSNNIYILNVVVKKKKHFFSYVRRFTLPFFYNGSIIAFKTIRGKMVYRLGDDLLEMVRIKNGWKLIRQPQTIQVKLPVNGGYLYLSIRKNR